MIVSGILPAVTSFFAHIVIAQSAWSWNVTLARSLFLRGFQMSVSRTESSSHILLLV